MTTQHHRTPRPRETRPRAIPNTDDTPLTRNQRLFLSHLNRMRQQQPGVEWFTTWRNTRVTTDRLVKAGLVKRRPPQQPRTHPQWQITPTGIARIESEDTS